MNKNKSKPKIFKTAALILFFIVVAYILFQLFMVSVPNVRTETAIKYDISDTLSCNAIVSMPQEEIVYSGGIADYVISSGDKVSAGAVLARIFETSEQAVLYKKALLVNEEISLLKNSQRSSAGINIAALLSQSSTSLYSIIDSIQSNNFSKIHSQKSLLQSAINKTNIATGEAANYEDRIALLTQSYTALIDASGASQEIKAPKNGYFVSSSFCSKQLYNSSQLKDMSPQDLKAAAESESLAVESNILGHLVYDYRWECYIATNAQHGKKFIEGQNVYLTFTEISNFKIPATIASVEINESGDAAKITLSSSYMNRDIAAVQLAKVDITFKNKSSDTFTGIRISKEALRIVNGEYGVYIKYGNLTQYRKISILFENDNYILCPLTYEKDKNEIKLYDEVIVEGRGFLPDLSQSQSQSLSQKNS